MIFSYFIYKHPFVGLILKNIYSSLQKYLLCLSIASSLGQEQILFVLKI